MNTRYSFVLLLLVGIASASAARGDTIKLKANGSEINGRVTFSHGVFEIEADFKAAKRSISIDSDKVSEVQFNDVTNNPEDDAPGWIMNLSAAKADGVRDAKDARVLVRFFDTQAKDAKGNLDVITTDAITVQGSKYVKSSVRWIRLQIGT